MTLKKDKNSTSESTNQKVLDIINEYGLDATASIMTTLLNEAMKSERAETLGAKPYERSKGRKGYANGFKPKTVMSRSGKLELQIPQARGMQFYPKSLEKGIRSEKALKLAIAEMYVKGVSTRKISKITEELCGHKISASQVSRISKVLDKEVQNFKNRRLGYYPYIYLDARYERVREGGVTKSFAVLIALGVTDEGRREVLGFSVSNSEAKTHWTEFLRRLQERKICGVKYIVSDDHQGLKNAILETFNGVYWQRCQFHFSQNSQSFATSKDMKSEIANDVRDIFHSGTLDDAKNKVLEIVKKYEDKNPAFSYWLEENIEDCFAVYSLPRKYRVKLRTVNPLENLNRHIKRRTRLVSVFPNRKSCERLVGAILIEVHDDWMADSKIYMKMDDWNREEMKKRSKILKF